jgi:hypothetical protein
MLALTFAAGDGVLGAAVVWHKPWIDGHDGISGRDLGRRPRVCDLRVALAAVTVTALPRRSLTCKCRPSRRGQRHHPVVMAFGNIEGRNLREEG